MWPFKKRETQEERELDLTLNEEDVKKFKGKKLKFDSVKHEYSLGDTILTSVTTCIKTFFEPFDRDYWADYIANRDGKTTEEVLYEWQEQQDWGNKVHKLIENYIKKGKLKKDYPNEVLKAIDFLRSLPSAKITPEKTVFSIKWMVAGKIDVVIETPEGVILIDWKTIKKLRMENSYQQAKAPLSHLDDCNYNRYVLQLNLYKTLFEQQFGKKVIGMGIVKLADVGPLEYFPVEDFSREVGLMMDHFMKHRNRIV